MTSIPRKILASKVTTLTSNKADFNVGRRCVNEHIYYHQLILGTVHTYACTYVTSKITGYGGAKSYGVQKITFEYYYY